MALSFSFAWLVIYSDQFSFPQNACASHPIPQTGRQLLSCHLSAFGRPGGKRRQSRTSSAFSSGCKWGAELPEEPVLGCCLRHGGMLLWGCSTAGVAGGKEKGLRRGESKPGSCGGFWFRYFTGPLCTCPSVHPRKRR